MVFFFLSMSTAVEGCVVVFFVMLALGFSLFFNGVLADFHTVWMFEGLLLISIVVNGFVLPILIVFECVLFIFAEFHIVLNACFFCDDQCLWLGLRCCSVFLHVSCFFCWCRSPSKVFFADFHCLWMARCAEFRCVWTACFASAHGFRMVFCWLSLLWNVFFVFADFQCFRMLFCWVSSCLNYVLLICIALNSFFLFDDFLVLLHWCLLMFIVLNGRLHVLIFFDVLFADARCFWMVLVCWVQVFRVSFFWGGLISIALSISIAVWMAVFGCWCSPLSHCCVVTFILFQWVLLTFVVFYSLCCWCK